MIKKTFMATLCIISLLFVSVPCYASEIENSEVITNDEENMESDFENIEKGNSFSDIETIKKDILQAPVVLEEAPVLLEEAPVLSLESSPSSIPDFPQYPSDAWQISGAEYILVSSTDGNYYLFSIKVTGCSLSVISTNNVLVYSTSETLSAKVYFYVLSDSSWSLINDSVIYKNLKYPISDYGTFSIIDRNSWDNYSYGNASGPGDNPDSEDVSGNISGNEPTVISGDFSEINNLLKKIDSRLERISPDISFNDLDQFLSEEFYANRFEYEILKNNRETQIILVCLCGLIIVLIFSERRRKND